VTLGLGAFLHSAPRATGYNEGVKRGKHERKKERKKERKEERKKKERRMHELQADDEH
jgi:hypothetical protein